MTNKTKIIIAVLAIVGVLVALDFTIPHVKTVVVKSSTFGATGDVYNTNTLASVGFNNATITPAAILNNSGRDRVITRVFMTGNTPNVYGTSTIYRIDVATSTNQYNLLNSAGATNSNFLVSSTGQVSNPAHYNYASTTIGNFSTLPAVGVGGLATNNASTTGLVAEEMVWPNGTYVVFTISSSTDMINHVSYSGSGALNGTSNNNLNLGSTTSGFMGVEYYPQ